MASSSLPPAQLSGKKGRRVTVSRWDGDQRHSPGDGGPSLDAPATAFNTFLPTGFIRAGHSAWSFKSSS